MLQFGLIGFSQGYYAVNYLRFLKRLKDIEITGICDCGRDDGYVRECAFLTAKEFAEEMSAPLFHDYRELLDKHPDAVLICSETCEHIEMAKEAVTRGVHTFVSKPLSFDPADVQSLLDKAPGDVRLLCGNPLKYEHGIEEIKQKLGRNEIGTIYSVRLMINHLAMTQQVWERDPERSGGPLGTYGIYLCDLIRWVTGKEFSTVYAIGGNFGTPVIKGPDTVKVAARLTDGTLCSLELFSAVRHNYPFVQMELTGVGGTLMTKYDNYMTVTQTETGCRFGALRNNDMGAAEMEHFLDCIRNDRKERCSARDMLEVARVIKAVSHSLASGKEVILRGKES